MDTGHLMDGRYRLLERLGAGGMSVVWRAHDEVLERDVAVKVLSPELAADPKLLHRIRAEARSAARLRHPNIVEVYDYGEAPGGDGPPVPYVVMEVVEGRSLAQLLTGGALPWRVAVLICAQVAAALAAAHGRGVVHRDVKPGNVMVAGGGVKLVDFGVSATSGETDAAGQLIGTPAYLAPERLKRGAVRPATDVYALGLLLYRALAGKLPWRASTTTEMLAAHRYHEPATLPAIADLPPEVSELCRRCLDKDPGNRPSAADVAKALGSVAGLAPAALLLSDVDTAFGAGAVAPSTPTRTAVHLSGLAGTVAPYRPAQRFGAPLRRWRHLPQRGRVAVVAASVTMLLASGALGVDMLTGGSSGDDDRARAGTPAAVAGLGQRKPECTVAYAIRRAVNGRFSTTVRILNTGPIPVPDGRLAFTFPGEQRLLHGSPGTWRQQGRSVQARIGELPAKASRTATIEATYRGVNALPDRFQLNDTSCRAVLSVAGQPTPPAPKRDGKEERDDEKDGKKDEGKGDDEKNEDEDGEAEGDDD